MARFLRTETNSSGGHSRLRPPTVVGTVVYFARPIEGYLTPPRSRNHRTVGTKLRPPAVVLVPQKPPRPILVTLAAKQPAHDPRRATDASVFHPAVIDASLGQQGGIGIWLAPSFRGRAKSRLSPPAVVTQPSTQVFFGPETKLVRIRPRRTVARLRPVPAAFRPIGFKIEVALAYSKRGKPKSILRKPTLIDLRPQVYFLSVTLAPSKRGTPKSRLEPPTVLAVTSLAAPTVVSLARIRPVRTLSRVEPPTVVFTAVELSGPETTLAPSHRGRTKSVLARPTDLVDAADLGFVRVHRAYSLRGKAKSRLAPPTVVGPILARPAAIYLAPSFRGIPRSRLEPPTVVAPFIARPTDITLARIRPPRTTWLLGKPTDLVDQADLGFLRVHLAYSKRGTPGSKLALPTVVFTAVELSGPEVTLVRIRPPRTIWLLRPPVAGAAQLKAEYDLRVTLAYSLRGKPKSKLRPPVVVTAATPYFRREPVALAPQRRGKAKPFLNPPVVVGAFSARPVAVHLAPSRFPTPKSSLPQVVYAARVYVPIQVTLAPAPRQGRRPIWVLQAPTVVRPRFVAVPIQVTLAPSHRPKPGFVVTHAPVAKPPFFAAPISISLARITPPKRFYRLSPPALVGAGIFFRGIQTHLAYSLRGRPIYRLTLTEVQITECYGVVSCGFTFAAEVCGEVTAATVTGATSSGATVSGGDTAATAEGASESRGTVSGRDEQREGC